MIYEFKYQDQGERRHRISNQCDDTHEDQVPSNNCNLSYSGLLRI